MTPLLMLSSESINSCEKACYESLLDNKGLYKIRYQHHDEWDFALDSPHKSIDVSLILPHYRARNQPVDHRLSMLVGAGSQPVKLKICRPASHRSRFFLEVQAHLSDITVWLPSDFKGHISHPGKAIYSSGFVNRVMPNVRINEGTKYEPLPNEDELVVFTKGKVTLRMWDINTCAPECLHKETLKRLFGCKERAPETAVNWDFLLEG